VKTRSAFTLLELVISTAIAAMILVGAYSCLNAAFASQKMIEPRSEIFQTARVAMSIISADLRAACPLVKDMEFVGMERTLQDGTEADNLDFATHNYTPRRLREADYCQVSYFLEKTTNGQYSLWRRRNPTLALDPLAGGAREEIAQGLVGFRLEYYDGYDWYPTWGKSVQDTKKGITEAKDPNKKNDPEASNLYGMPEAVRVTLFFESDPKRKPAEETASTTKRDDSTNAPPYIFQTIARLELATTVAAGSSSATNSSQTGGNN